jgi:hypothetical protein
LPKYEPSVVSVETSHTGHFFSGARTRWDHHFGRGPTARSWSEGRFKLDKTFVALRLHFERSEEGGPVAVREIEFGAAPDPSTVEAIPALDLWVWADATGAPSLDAGAEAFDPRLFGWLCHRFGFSGVYITGLMRWPSSWTPLEPGRDPSWMAAAATPWLFYPGPEGPLPSLRSERFRDGLEDYALLAQGAEQGITDGEPLADAASLMPGRALVELLPEGREPSRHAADELPEALMAYRVQLGRRLMPSAGRVSIVE